MVIYNNIEEMVGNTPLLLIPQEIHNIPKLKLYAKCELFNPFGSIKDRIAFSMLEPQLDDAKKHNKTIIESSSGNTAKALSVLAKKNKLDFRTVTNKVRVKEMKEILHLLGAEVTELPGTSECPDPNNPEEPHAIIDKLIKQEPDKFLHTDQFFNQRNVLAHKKTGEEIINELLQVEYAFFTLGTCGSGLGIGKTLRSKNNCKIIGVITSGEGYSPGGRNQNELYEVGLFDKSFYEKIVHTSENDSIESMLELNHKVGLLCGPTTGLTFAALKKYFKDNPLQEESTAVFIACDRLEPYISYLKKEHPKIFFQEEAKQEVEEDFFAQELTIDSFESLQDKIVIDIRTPFAYKLGNIEGSINIPENVLRELIRSGPFLPRKPIVLVCPIGAASIKYAYLLEKLGYEAYTLKDGLQGWMKLHKK